jgi:ABC-type branched-subunit amino acid transport system ATPase component
MRVGRDNGVTAPVDLVLRQVGRRFGGYWAARSVTIHIRAGRVTALIGPNGAGKTTVFHLISGDLTPDTGTIVYRGIDITGFPPWRIARLGVGKSFQDVRVFRDLTVFDQTLVAMLGPREESLLGAWLQLGGIERQRRRRSAEVMRWLEVVDLAERKGDLGRELSFGQQKLLSIARLMAGGADLLLLDEPTAGVSGHLIRKIEELLHRLVTDEKKTIVIIEHNMSVVSRLANWVHFMHDGQVAFSGRADHVLGDEEVRRTYMGL